MTSRWCWPSHPAIEMSSSRRSGAFGQDSSRLTCKDLTAGGRQRDRILGPYGVDALGVETVQLVLSDMAPT